MRSRGITVRAPAKINLFLEVLGRRPDGYHNVRSLMAHVSLYDVLTFTPTSGPIRTTVKVSGVPVWAGCRLAGGRENLATRAALALREATGYRGGAVIRLEKHIPVCGGLGGGSADAAATLRALNRLWGTGLTTDDLRCIARTLGSDVPAMVYGGIVTLEGMGEQVTPVEVKKNRQNEAWHVVLVNPGFGVSTRDICARYRSTLTSARGQYKGMVSAVANWDMEATCRRLFNSLEKTVFGKYPLLAMIAEGLREAGARGVLLCGSGASVFALAAGRPHARAIAKKIGRSMGPWLWTRVAEVLPDGVTVAHGPLEARV